MKIALETKEYGADSVAGSSSVHSLINKCREATDLLISKAKQSRYWNTQTFLILGALTFGLLSAFLAELNRRSREGELKNYFATNTVLTLVNDLAEGEIIERSNIAMRDVLVRSSSRNYADEGSLDLVVGKAAKIDLVAGDPILLSALEGAVSDERMAERIPPGKRLFTLVTKDLSASKGVIRPNDHVDILAHMDLPGRGPTTFTLLQDVTLVSVGRSSVLNSEKAGGMEVSFFIDSLQTEMMAFAQARGEFSLSLRHESDIAVRDQVKGMDLRDFLDDEKLAPITGGSELEVIENGKEVRR